MYFFGILKKCTIFVVEMDKTISIYFTGAKGVPQDVHDGVKSFRNKVLDETGVRLTLQRAYIELVKTGLANKPKFEL